MKRITLVWTLLAAALLPTPGFAQISCSREGLQRVVDLYIAAQTKGDTTGLPLAAGVQIREWLGTNLYGRIAWHPERGIMFWEPAIWLLEPTSPILEKEGTPATWRLDQKAYDQAIRELGRKKL